LNLFVSNKELLKKNLFPFNVQMNIKLKFDDELGFEFVALKLDIYPLIKINYPSTNVVGI
jgi:hypothetical protein